LSLLLLIGAGLFVRTLQNLRDVNVGFATDHLITFGLEPSLAGYSQSAVEPLQKRVLERLTSLPGVESAAATSDPELADNGVGQNISVQGYTPRAGEDMDVEAPRITPDYFATLKVPLLAGRAFTPGDDAGQPSVAVVNEALADRFFGSPQKAVGRMLASGSGNKINYDIRIVGVARNYIHHGVRGKVKITMYRPAAQDQNPGGMQYYVRTWGAPQAAMSMIRGAAGQIDSQLVLEDMRTMNEQIDQNISESRMIALLAVCFGALATLLAGIGLYGVLAYATAQRTREIGVRMALGADRGGVLKLVLKDVLLLAGISVAVTIPLALLATRVLKSMLFGVSDTDPVVYVAATLLIVAVVLAGAALPARRAANVEPMQALRNE
jgi:predicted permease